MVYPYLQARSLSGEIVGARNVVRIDLSSNAHGVRHECPFTANYYTTVIKEEGAGTYRIIDEKNNGIHAHTNHRRHILGCHLSSTFFDTPELLGSTPEYN